ncbi:MAG TPA: hypothetical protein VGO34_14990 [Alphaproteobacteria bacterium]|jgi:hypothetical protein
MLGLGLSLTRPGRGRSAISTPEGIFGVENVVVMLRTDDPANRAVADSLITSLTNTGASGGLCANDNPANQPAFVVGGGPRGRDIARSLGTGNVRYLALPAGNPSQGQPLIQYAIYKPASGTTDKTRSLTASLGGMTGIRLGYDGSGQCISSVYAGGAADTEVALGAALDSWLCTIHFVDGSNSWSILNADEKHLAGGDVGENSFQQGCLFQGGGFTLDTQYVGDFLEYGIIAVADPTDDQVAKLVAYANSRRGA